jgi:phage N-6-adenine-methyltransferase
MAPTGERCPSAAPTMHAEWMRPDVTLVGFKARNHPQQVRVDKVDDRETPATLFEPLHARHNFTIDVAASAANAKLTRFYTLEDDGLTRSWMGERVWCNPPYSNLGAWVAKAWHERDHGCELVVMLLPANRTEQSWWQELVEPHRDCASGLSVEFIAGRLRFDVPGGYNDPRGNRPPFGVCLLTWAKVSTAAPRPWPSWSS